MLLPPSNLTFISFTEPRLELRDENLQDEKFQMENTHHNPSPAVEIIKEENLNIDWIDEERMEGADCCYENAT